MIKSNTTTALPTDGSVDVAQVLANMYSYYSSIGVNTAGFPTTDTLICPKLTAVACEYQFFNKNYVLFSYDSTTFNGDNFAVRDPFYTKWKGLGGMDGLGAAIDIERNITVNGGNATVQLYVNGDIYNNTSGTLNGRIFAVMKPVSTAYAKYGGYSGFLGLPTSDDLVLAGGGHRQSFQGGNFDYAPGADAVLRLPVEFDRTPAILEFDLSVKAGRHASIARQRVHGERFDVDRQAGQLGQLKQPGRRR